MTVFSIRWRTKGRVVSGPDRPDGVPSYPPPPRLASPPCAAPTRAARGLSGFWIRQVMLYTSSENCTRGSRYSISISICRIPNPDIPRASRVGAPGGAAGRGRARLGANRIIRPRNKSLPFPPRHRKNFASTSF